MKRNTKRLLSLAICLVMLISMLPMASLAADTATTLYCQTSWNNCNVYWWGSSTTVGWPGNAMTKNEEGIWTYDVPSDATNVIFNNGSIQTADLVMPKDENVMYVIGPNYWTGYGKVEIEAVYYVAGDFNGWNASAEGYQMVKDEEGTYSLSLVLLKGEYQLKVTNGTWDQSWGDNGGNVKFSVDSESEVSIVFDPTAGTVQVLGGKDPDPMTITSIHAVGVGGLLGADWDSTANQMTAAEGVYSITLENIAAGTYEYKFAANGGWDLSWGNGGETASGETYEAYFNGGNNTLVVAEDGSTVTLVLDMTALDAITGAGVTCTATVVVPGSEEPTPEEPTPGEPTPEEPTPGVNYFVAGTMNGWNAAAEGYQLTADENGTYSITLTLAAGDHELKVTDGTWANSWGDNGGNICFTLKEETTITVIFNSADQTVAMEGVPQPDPDPLTINSIHAVGVGGLLGADWDPAANEMTATDGVYFITLENIAAGTYEYKFAANGGWDLSWGNGGETVSGEFYEAYFNGGNNTLVVAEDGSTVTLILDMNAMDIYTGAGATCTATVVASGSEEPTPEEPTPGEPTPEEPTPVVNYFVAGTMNGWNAAAEGYQLTADENGTYSITLTLAAGDHELKVTDGTWDNSWGNNGGNITFTLKEETTITVIFNSADQTVAMEGVPQPDPDPLTINSIHAVGFGGLLGADWDPAANEMTAADGVYSITLENIAAGTYEYKFAANGGWDLSWGNGGETVSGESYEAYFNGGNNTLVVAEDGSTVTLTLDLTAMDIYTGAGATCTATVVASGSEDPTPDEPTPEEPTPVVNYFVAGTMNGWDPAAEGYQLTDNGDGTFSIALTLAAGDHELKLTDGSWANSWGDNGGNIGFTLKEETTITVIFNSADQTIVMEGVPQPDPDPLTINSIHAVGFGGLLGADWDPSANQMTAAEGVYSITLENIAAGTYEYKFAANGGWDLSWGNGGETASGETYEAYFNGGNNKLVVAEDGSTVTLTLDLTAMDIYTGVGATCTATVVAPVAPAPVAPTVTLKYPTLSFEDVIVMNVYYAAENLDDVVEMGLVTFSEKLAAANIEDAKSVVPGYTWSETDKFYFSSTKGIAAKDLGDTVYFAVYAKLSDGSYYYTSIFSYSPKTYAYNQLKNGDANTKALVAAMLNYGAAAQKYFNYNTDALVNSSMTDAQQALVEKYSASMIANVVLPDDAKKGEMINNGGYTKRYPTISFEGAFCINYYFVPSAAPVGDVTMYVWNQADFDAAEALSKDNATEAITMEIADNGEYLAVVDGIAAKYLDSGVYVSFCYSDGTTDYCSGVIGYSIGAYCKNQAATSGAMADLAAATAVYGYYAKQMFA